MKTTARVAVRPPGEATARRAGTVTRMPDTSDENGDGRVHRTGRDPREGSAERSGGPRGPGAPGGPGAAVPAADPGSEAERRRKRAVFLREMDEARALRERVQPRRARANRMRQQMRMRTFRW